MIDNEVWLKKLEALKKWKADNIKAEKVKPFKHKDFDRVKWIGNIPYESRVLDVGCGHDLKFSDYQKAINAKHYVGIDPGYSGRDITQGKAEKMPYDSKSFDYVFLISVLQHCQSPIDVLSECRRVLKDGGILIASVYCTPVNSVFTYEFSFDSSLEMIGQIFRLRDHKIIERDRSIYIRAEAVGIG